MDKWKSFFGLALRRFFLTGSVKANGVVLQDMVTKFSTTHTMVAWAFAMQNAAAYFFGPCTKLLMETFSGRSICVIGGLLVGLAYISFGILVEATWQLFLMSTICGIGFGLLNYPTFMNMQAHFKEQFATYSAVVSLSEYVGIASLPPLLHFLISSYDLEEGLVLFGAIMLNLVLAGVCYREPVSKERESEYIPISGSETEIARSSSEETAETEDKTCRSSLAEDHSLFEHKAFILLLAIDTVFVYVYTSWAIFLVTLGHSAGLSYDKAVLLSSSGGAGGLIGNICAIILFSGEYMNAYNGLIIPIIVNGTCFLGCAMAKSFLWLAVLSFFNGWGLGMISAALLGILPSVVCKHHLGHSVIWTYFLNGIAIQFGGLFSGFLQDTFGSAQFVFAFNAFMSLLSFPLTILFAISSKYLENRGSES